jgi:hypothetical protein
MAAFAFSLILRHSNPANPVPGGMVTTAFAFRLILRHSNPANPVPGGIVGNGGILTTNKANVLLLVLRHSMFHGGICVQPDSAAL